MPGRNAIIFVSTIFLASIFLATMVQSALAAAPAGLQVKIDSGTVEGKASGPVRAFLGIPYAAPPLGELRWKPPAPKLP